jgi:hypothetical protein
MVSPIAGAIAGLFRRGENEAPPPPAYYVPPPPVEIHTALTPDGQLSPVSYGAGGMPRTTDRPLTPGIGPITVQVNAIDSRSFSDHSDEIARAVREAMLNGHALTDIVTEY